MKNMSFKKELLLAALCLAILIIIPFFTSSRVALDFVIRLASYGIFATSLNILVGYGGMVSFGHALFLEEAPMPLVCLCRKPALLSP